MVSSLFNHLLLLHTTKHLSKNVSGSTWNTLICYNWIFFLMQQLNHYPSIKVWRHYMFEFIHKYRRYWGVKKQLLLLCELPIIFSFIIWEETKRVGNIETFLMRKTMESVYMLQLAEDKFCRRNNIVLFPIMDGELILITIAWGLSLQFFFFFGHILYDFPNFQDHYLLLFSVINLPSYIKILLHMGKHQIPCQCSIGWFRPLYLSL